MYDHTQEFTVLLACLCLYSNDVFLLLTPVLSFPVEECPSVGKWEKDPQTLQLRGLAQYSPWSGLMHVTLDGLFILIPSPGPLKALWDQDRESSVPTCQVWRVENRTGRGSTAIKGGGVDNCCLLSLQTQVGVSSHLSMDCESSDTRTTSAFTMLP